MENNQNLEQSRKALVAALIGHTLWGFSFMASRVGLNMAHMFVLLSHRFVIAFLIMNLFVLFGVAKLDFKGKSPKILLLLGLMEPVIYFFGEQYGILHSNTIFSGVMIAMIPIFSTLAAAPLLKEMPTIPQLIFSLISVGGVIGIGMMSKSSGELEFGGVIALIIAVLSAVVFTVLSRGISSEYPAFLRTYTMMAVGAITFTGFAIVHCRDNFAEYIEPFQHGSYIISILFLAIGCSVGSYFLNSYALTYMTVARETVFANLTTAVSVFAGAVFLDEHFSLIGLLFCAMILGGIYGVQKSSKEL